MYVMFLEESVDYLSLFIQFSSVQSLSRLRLLATPWIATCQASHQVHHQLPEFIQTHVHRVRDAIQPIIHYFMLLKKKLQGTGLHDIFSLLYKMHIE